MEAFTQLLADVPDAAWALPTQTHEGDVLFSRMGCGLFRE